MATQNQYQWRRDKDGLGVWDHRGKVAVAGYGHSPVDRRWDENSMDQSLGAYTILACKLAMEDAGVTPDQIDGIICCDSHIAGGSGGTANAATAEATAGETAAQPAAAAPAAAAAPSAPASPDRVTN